METVRVPIHNRIGHAIRRAQQAQRAALDGALRSLGVTTPQWAALSLLRDCPGLTNAEIARRYCATPQTMNAIVVHLESVGLVRRRAIPGQGHVLLTTLTEDGERLLEECDRIADAVEAHMLSGLAEPERRHLADLLGRIIDALQVPGCPMGEGACEDEERPVVQ